VKPKLHTHTNLELRLPPALHTSYTRTVDRPHYVEMSSQGVISSKEAGPNPGLHPVKGQ